jgi:hypothetical protein
LGGQLLPNHVDTGVHHGAGNGATDSDEAVPLKAGDLRALSAPGLVGIS